MSIAEMLHSMNAEGRANIIDYDLDVLAVEYPALVPVFEETQYLRREVERLMEDLFRLQTQLDDLR